MEYSNKPKQKNSLLPNSPSTTTLITSNNRSSTILNKFIGAFFATTTPTPNPPSPFQQGKKGVASMALPKTKTGRVVELILTGFVFPLTLWVFYKRRSNPDYTFWQTYDRVLSEQERTRTTSFLDWEFEFRRKEPVLYGLCIRNRASASSESTGVVLGLAFGSFLGATGQFYHNLVGNRFIRTIVSGGVFAGIMGNTFPFFMMMLVPKKDRHDAREAFLKYLQQRNQDRHLGILGPSIPTASTTTTTSQINPAAK